VLDLVGERAAVVPAAAAPAAAARKGEPQPARGAGGDGGRGGRKAGRPSGDALVQLSRQGNRRRRSGGRAPSRLSA
jgi:hypothetical protein